MKFLVARMQTTNYMYNIMMLLFITSTLFADKKEKEIEVVKWNTLTSGGAATRYVNDIAHHRKEGVWLAMSGRVTHYDGEKWKHYDRTNAPLSREYYPNIHAVEFDSSGTLWIVPYDRGLISVKKGKWNTIDSSITKVPLKGVKNIVTDKNGDLWATPHYYGQSFIHRNNNVWRALDTNNYSFPDQDFDCISRDHNGNIWLVGSDLYGNSSILVGGDKRFIGKYDGKQWIYLHSDSSGFDGNLRVNEIQATSNGEIWLNHKKGISHFDGLYWDHISKEHPNIGEEEIKKIFVDSKDNVWISKDNELLVVKNGSWSPVKLPNASVSSLIPHTEDHNGRIWFSVISSKRAEWGVYIKDGDSWIVQKNAETGLVHNGITRAYNIADTLFFIYKENDYYSSKEIGISRHTPDGKWEYADLDTVPLSVKFNYEKVSPPDSSYLFVSDSLWEEIRPQDSTFYIAKKKYMRFAYDKDSLLYVAFPKYAPYRIDNTWKLGIFNGNTWKEDPINNTAHLDSIRSIERMQFSKDGSLFIMIENRGVLQLKSGHKRRR